MNIIITGTSGFVGLHLTDILLPRAWQKTLSQADVIITLTGKNIFGYWTQRYKSQIYDSRILTIRHIVDALQKDNHALLLNTSAIGYYGGRVTLC